MGGQWVVHEGYLNQHHAATGHLHLPHAPLVERYFVLYLNRKLEIYESNAKDVAHMESCYVRGFCGWDGHGVLKAGESYGLELKLDKYPQDRIQVAAFNRLDLERWCRGFMAVVDPESAAGQEVRRERRKARKEEKRQQEEKEAKIRQWKEHQKKLMEDEKRRLQAREEEIMNMTPLERIDGLGTLDEDTARLLEKRKQRLQRRQAPTTRRVNKAAYRQRLEDAAGGKVDSLQPLPAKTVEQRSKVRIEPPPPGEFIEVARTGGRRFSSPGRHRSHGSDSERSSSPSSESRFSSSSREPHSNGSISGSAPPPPPPPRSDDGLRASEFIPPPPPPPFPIGDNRHRRSQSVRGSLIGDAEDMLESSRASTFSRSSRRLSGVDRQKQGVQDNLAAILSGRAPESRRSKETAKATPPQSSADSSMANAFAASLAAIRQNRVDSMDMISLGGDPPETENRTVRESRQRSLSAEGKALLRQAISSENGSKTTKKPIAHAGRKGLFDDSDSSDANSDDELFGGRKSTRKNADIRPSKSAVPTPRTQDTRFNPRGSIDEVDGGFGNGNRGSDIRHSYSDATSPRSVRSAQSSTTGNGVLPTSRNVEVVFKSCVVQAGKKPVGVYTFAFRLQNGTEHSFAFSYHEFEAIHERLASDASVGSRLPKFPSKHWYRNNTKPENMQKRAMEFVDYFKQLVSIPGVFSNDRFVFEYRISDSFIQGLQQAMTPGSSIPRTNGARITPRNPEPRNNSSAFASTTPTQAPRSVVKPPASSRKTPLFGDDNDSESDDDSVVSRTPRRRDPRDDEGRRSSLLFDDRESTKQKKKEKKQRPPTNGSVDIAMQTAKASDVRSRGTAPASRTSADMGAKQAPTATEGPEPKEAPAQQITGLPPRPNLFGGGRGDLLAAIRQGKELKRVESSGQPSLPPAGRGSSAPATASAPAPQPLPPPVVLGQAASIGDAISNAMASRRIHVEYEEQSDDSDDDWD
ncbi:hypothetical protein PINS_up014503 [Pythium insidiosum]|nr:hypothetical protein PINS_up014503 [Pythium insidiosum]